MQIYEKDRQHYEKSTSIVGGRRIKTTIGTSFGVAYGCSQASTIFSYEVFLETVEIDVLLVFQ